MKQDEIYPAVIPWDFAPVLRTLKEAKELAAIHNVKPVKVANGYLVKYKGTISNVCTTGRKMYVIDNEGNLHNQVLTLTRSYPYDQTYKISGFTGAYVCRSSLNTCLDIYVNCSFDNSDYAKNIIKELSNKTYNEYLTHMEQCRPSRHILQTAMQSDWQKAKELNYI